jgi:hypothetical protein
MKTHILLLVTALSLFTVITSLHGQGTAFTYQGRLNDGANPANGSYDLRFIIYDNSAGGSQQGPILTNAAAAASNGLFTVTLDFGNQFPGAARWLEISVRTNGGGGFSTLSPRQSLTPTPYTIYAGGANAAGLNGIIGAANIGDSTITSTKLATGSVGSSQLATNIGIWSRAGASIFHTNGNVGIGTVTPSRLFQVGDNNISGPEGYIRLGSRGSTSSGVWDIGVPSFGNLPYNFTIGEAGSGAPALVIEKSTGNVGIGTFDHGTFSPGNKLQVKGTDNNQLRLFGDPGPGNVYDFSYWDFYTESYLDSGNLIILSTSGNYFYVNQGTGAFGSSSDVRLKKDIASLGPVLDRVMQLHPVTFRFKATSEDKKKSLGFIAQEIEPIFPEVVDECAHSKAVAYSELIPITIAAVQETNQKLERELKRRDAENAELKQRLEKLERLVERRTAGR